MESASPVLFNLFFAVIVLQFFFLIGMVLVFVKKLNSMNENVVDVRRSIVDALESIAKCMATIKDEGKAQQVATTNAINVVVSSVDNQTEISLQSNKAACEKIEELKSLMAANGVLMQKSLAETSEGINGRLSKLVEINGASSSLMAASSASIQKLLTESSEIVNGKLLKIIEANEVQSRQIAKEVVALKDTIIEVTRI